jgi:transposase-like protein
MEALAVNLTDPRFTDPNKAREYLEMQRWPLGPTCTHCGSDNVTTLKGKAHRPGVYQCNEPECRQQFTVTTGSVMERSKIPLNKWLLAMHLIASSKKGYSAHQLHRTLGITYQSAWFLAHRIREAMTDDPKAGPLGGEGKTVEADETYIGNKKGAKRRKVKVGENINERGFVMRGGGPHKKYKIVALVERGGRSYAKPVDNITVREVRDVLVTRASRKSDLRTDESWVYPSIGKEFASHETVNHKAGEYGRGDVHTNTIEGYFSIFKRGMKGVYQHCREKHLHRYLAEYDFRYNHRSKLGYNDGDRAALAVKNAAGKRLTYRGPDKKGLH